MAKKEIKYKSALLPDGKVINIDNVTKGLDQKYFCPNPHCNENLIPRLGEKNARHFAHKIASCNFETYLHFLAKKMFLEEYNKCLEDNQPFYLEYQENQTCTSCQNINELPNSCTLPPKNMLFNLTPNFSIISREKGIEKFVADILLKSTNDKNSILIEFAVTHKCEPKKINSDLRIIEYHLKEEKDLDFIKKRKIREQPGFCIYHNFMKRENRAPSIEINRCTKKFNVFHVNKSGKALRKRLITSEISQLLHENEYLHLQNLDLTGNTDIRYFKDLVIESSNRGILVKNCFACRFFTRNNRYDREFEYWCKRWKAEVENSNYGARCPKFWRIERE